MTTSEPMDRFCRDCGRELQPDWRNCPGCGRTLSAAQPERPPSEWVAKSMFVPRQQARASQRQTWIVIGALVVGLAVLGLVQLLPERARTVGIAKVPVPPQARETHALAADFRVDVSSMTVADLRDWYTAHMPPGTKWRDFDWCEEQALNGSRTWYRGATGDEVRLDFVDLRQGARVLINESKGDPPVCDGKPD